jgi:hypothetical protein
MLESTPLNSILNHTQEPLPPVEIEGELRYEIKTILNSKINKWCKCSLLYPVKWSGYEGTNEETSWLPASELNNASKSISNFHSAYPSKPGPLSSL